MDWVSKFASLLLGLSSVSSHKHLVGHWLGVFERLYLAVCVLCEREEEEGFWSVVV